MKKLMIALAVVAVAAASQAATVNWLSSDMPTGVKLADLNGNTAVSANGAGLPYISGTAMDFVLEVYTQDGLSKLGTGVGSLEYDMMDDTISVYNINVSGATFDAGTTYKYIATITGTQGDMASYADASWDYSAASLTAKIEGTFIGKLGTPTIMSGVPSSWTVSGAVPIPEPTGGLLLLLGVAGLALRRRRA